MIYLDHNATTPLDPRVREAMAPFLDQHFGNASSLHRHGRLARNAVDGARVQVAALAGAEPGQVVFTSGGTEADNLALLGTLADAAPARLLVSAVEHSAVLEPAKRLARRGVGVEPLPVDADCRLDLAALEAALGATATRGPVRLVSVMLANNETGAIQDVPRIAALCRAAGALLHVDAVQATGKLPLDLAALGAHLLSLSAHKMGGPKGAGALVVDRALALEPLIAGGGQEHGLRGGTEPVAQLVGFGAAAELAQAELPERTARLRALRDRLEAALGRIPGGVAIAAAAERLPNTVQFALPGFDGAALVMALDRKGFAVATGSACHSGRPSHVLAAMGLPEPVARGAIRVSLGPGNTAAEVDAFAAALAEVAATLPGAVGR
jgi:cysteine desulfurase